MTDWTAIIRHASPDVRELNADVLHQDKRTALHTGADGRLTPHAAESMTGRFLTLWAALDGPELEPEHRFHPTRRWRFDFAHIGARVAIELEGGIHQQGRHNRAAGFVSDARKYNAAAVAGWTVFRLATGMLTVEDVRPIVEYVRGKCPPGDGGRSG